MTAKTYTNIMPRKCLLLLSLALFSLPGVDSWGKEGHEIVGNLAYKLLSNETKAAVHQILMIPPNLSHNKRGKEDPNSPLGDIADWADTVRHTSEFHWSGPLHYIDIHDNVVEGGCPVFHQTKEQTKKCHFEYDRDCSEDFCVAGSIVNYTKYLVEWKQQQQQQKQSTFFSSRFRGSADILPSKLVQESLKFVTHFIGDIHQPLHSARTTDRGGNSINVEFNDHGTNRLSNDHRHKKHKGWELHAVWDSGIIERDLFLNYQGSRAALEDELLDYILEAKDTGDMKKWLSCPDTRHNNCTTLWAEESWQNALEWAYKNSDTDETEVVSGTTLTEMYYETRLSIIKRLLCVAGVRLAASLEIALGQSSSPNAKLPVRWDVE